MAAVPRPYAITVNWNRGEDTVECVRSLLTDRPGISVIVVDNGSQDGSVELLRERFPGIAIIQNEVNEGYAKGVNQGIRMALDKGATHLLMVNNDAVVLPGAIGGLLDSFDRHPKAMIAGPKILYYGTDIIWFNGGSFNRWLGVSKHPMMDEKDRGQGEEGRADFITGCVMMVRAELFREVGLFDESFNIYAEDLDLCLRAEAKGYESWLVPSARAEHKVSASSGVTGSNTMTPYRAYYYGRNMLITVLKRTRGVKLLTCFLGQTFLALPYYFLLISVQKEKGAVKRYVEGYLDAVKLLLKGGMGGDAR